MYSYRIEQAIRAAAILHKDQLRKGSAPLPYVTHLFAVAMIVSDYTDDEDTIISALLHDTLEDTDYGAGEFQEDFGGKVREIVEALSEPKEVEGRSTTWKERKDIYANNSQNTVKIRLKGGTTSGFNSSARAAASHAAISSARNKPPEKLCARMSSRLPRHHAMAPSKDAGLGHDEQPVERVAQGRNDDNAGIHVAAVHRALLIENEEPQSAAARHHLRGRDKDERNG